MTGTHIQALTELILTGTPAEVATLTTAARHSGRLVHHTPPVPMGGRDPRIRIRLFLHPTR